jgi:hypothetical protein
MNISRLAIARTHDVGAAGGAFADVMEERIENGPDPSAAFGRRWEVCSARRSPKAPRAG